MALPASLLIANRGEIARRIIRTARRLGIASVAVFSDADANAPHVREADQAIAIGGGPARESYLNGPAILAAAADSGAVALHPGYGFLSENADFAQAVLDAGLVWVGPPPAAIRAMGRKDEAKRLMAAAGLAVTPGYLGEDQSPARLLAEAEAIGWPVLIKAVAGGGGRGMRRADGPADFGEALAGSRREAASAFGDDAVLLEKLIQRPRHLEVQVFADRAGRVVHLFERDCSLQRRHQKVIEEAPAPGLAGELRAAICAAAVEAARAVAYEGAGTIEFIADASAGLAADRVWFMEMNTRLQVEHPVTEAITGLDLVEWQLRIAVGESLPLAQDRIVMNGCAMEARLYAEDPATGFRPSTGSLRRYRLADGIRTDGGFEEGDAVSSFYDPMLAKLIAHGRTREEARTRLAAACKAVEVWPVKTNAAFLARCLEEADFVAGEPDTGLIERRLDTLVAKPSPPPGPVAAQLAHALGGTDHDRSHGPWGLQPSTRGWRLNAPPAALARLYVDGEAREGDPGDTTPLPPLVRIGGQDILFYQGAAFVMALTPPQAGAVVSAAADGIVRAPMPGRIAHVAVRPAEPVRAGQTLVVLEAMKMEHVLTATSEGTVAEVLAAVGNQVSEGAPLIRIDPAKSVGRGPEAEA